jgi:mannitol/fructose-specific phosphotransferase system IIA component (Ntr-type)
MIYFIKMAVRMSELTIIAQNAIEITENTEKYKAIRELICKAPVFSSLRNRKKLENAVFEREKIMSTAIGHGVAVAHGKTSAVRKTLVAFGISKDGILFDSPDGKPVHLLFIVVNPPRMCNEYLAILSAIARMSLDESLQYYITHTDSAMDVICKVKESLASSMHGRDMNPAQAN